MKEIHLLFNSLDNYSHWKEQKNCFKQTVKDLNLLEFVGRLRKISDNFYEEHFLKPCFKIEDAKYRLEIMEEILLSVDLFAGLQKQNIKLLFFKESVEKFREIKNENQKDFALLSLAKSFRICLNEFIFILRSCKTTGLLNLKKYFEDILIEKEQIFNLAEEILNEIQKEFSDFTLAINSDESKVIIAKYSQEEDEFAKFADDVSSYIGLEFEREFSIVDPAQLSVLEQNILELKTRNNKDIFEKASSFLKDNSDLLDLFVSLIKFYPQFEYYLTYIKFLKSLSKINYCKPIFSDNGFFAKGIICPSLIVRCLDNNTDFDLIVSNDVRLKLGNMFLLSGPNQGGKTIYLKAVGVNSFLAKCGCFVFAKECVIPFYDNIFTHFLQPEKAGEGRLIEEVYRMKEICLAVSEKSLVLMNESFASTRRKDGIDISIYFLNIINQRKASVGFVSHYYEIPELILKKGIEIEALSMGINSINKRTYSINWNGGNGNAFARDIAKRYNVTLEKMIQVLKGDK